MHFSFRQEPSPSRIMCFVTQKRRLATAAMKPGKDLLRPSLSTKTSRLWTDLRL